MQLHAGPFSYTWISDWAKVSPGEGFAHHGIAVGPDGLIYTGHATDAIIQVLDPEGALVREFPAPVDETHCLCFASEGGKPVLWISDIGGKGRNNGGPQVVKIDLEGRVLARLTKADTGYGADEVFKPTAVAVDPASGKIWVADGYGSSRVLLFSPELKLLRTIDGNDGLGRFKCPHWVFVDRRSGASEVWVADRANNRVQVYDGNGAFLRGVNVGLVAPSGFAAFGDYLVIAELRARLVVLDRKDNIVAYLGAGPQNNSRPGWPNRLDITGAPIPPHADIHCGEFNSPHGIAADPEGNLYVSEWLLGDRFTKLAFSPRR